MNTQEQLTVLKQARKDYFKSFNAKMLFKFKVYTNAGFCYYFIHKQDKCFYEISVLYEIYKRKTIKSDKLFWFKPGRIFPRLFYIQLAIFKIKNQFFWDWMKRQPEFCKHENKVLRSYGASIYKPGKICIIETCENCGEVFMRYENNTTKK